VMRVNEDAGFEGERIDRFSYEPRHMFEQMRLDRTRDVIPEAFVP